MSTAGVSHDSVRRAGAAAGGASAPQRQPSVVEGSFNPLVGQAAVNATGAPLAAPAGGSAVRRSGRPMSPPAPELPRPAVPAEAPGTTALCMILWLHQLI